MIYRDLFSPKASLWGTLQVVFFIPDTMHSPYFAQLFAIPPILHSRHNARGYQALVSKLENVERNALEKPLWEHNLFLHEDIIYYDYAKSKSLQKSILSPSAVESLLLPPRKIQQCFYRVRTLPTRYMFSSHPCCLRASGHERSACC